eukprot:TRINITY_DN3672_c0_g1_i7.p2 TRINITY_DN3672_c0_g1~~TRINITY_DN3672_c0_g1_i7.p2  ORF type:complete len:629 (+),score=239.74 TRINITY_DN3672_c0_g1_i7:76-1887(+)
MRAAAALLGLCGAAVGADPAHWWRYPHWDCGYDDVPGGSCLGRSVEGCKERCLATPGCGGFNWPHGVLKQRDCARHKRPVSQLVPVELFVLRSAPQPAAPRLWPLPAKYSFGNATADVGTDRFFTVPPSDVLQQAVQRYQKLFFPHDIGGAVSGSISGVVVTVDDTDGSHPQLGVDESYELSVPESGKATLRAQTVYGALRGLETLSQLIVFDFDSQKYTIPFLPFSATDAPRFPHRGLMIDTARHFQTLDSIRAVIDSLPYAKLNVLHWHMSDTQSFPMESRSSPKLWQGAHSPQERYLQSDIADMVEYARLRGVRVMVEFDMPGHAGSWCAGYPEVCPSPSCTQPLNVANNATFDLIEKLLMEMTGGKASAKGAPSPGLFKDNFIHLGGDEVNTGCWTKTPAIADWLQKQGMSADDAYAYFVKRAASYAIAQEHRPVQWSEVYDHFKTKLDKKTVVHIWKSVTNVTEVVANGYQVLLNVGYNSVSWYLDNIKVTWDNVYKNEPCNGVPDNLCPLILGGHGEMWGETVDMSDLEQTVWPRLGAIAEKLWSPRAATADASKNDALSRIERFRCILNRRGVRAAPVNNGQAREGPPGPGSCFDQ